MTKVRFKLDCNFALTGCDGVMSKGPVHDKICELVDKRIMNDNEVREILDLIEQNPEMKLEYEIQVKVKELLRLRCCRSKTPSALCQKVLSRIRKMPDN